MRPFLKWAGNKYRIIRHLISLLPPGDRLIEPFVGSGAVFLNTNYPRYLLAETNLDLINLYKILKQDSENFIRYAKGFFTQTTNHKSQYYRYRTLYNSTNDKRLKSALLLYFNKHGYNGLCRHNKQGKFNVPYGYYKKPYFPVEQMKFFHAKAKHAQFRHCDFLVTLKQAKRGDVIYCDPPYVPWSSTANFTNYSGFGFSDHQQKLLAAQAEILANKGIPVIISNHDTAFTRQIYRHANLHTIQVKRLISCKVNERKKVAELIAVFSPHHPNETVK